MTGTAKAVGTIENDVLIGHDNHLFLVGGAHRVLDYADGKVEPVEGSYRTFQLNIGQRTAWSRNLGAAYRHLVFPDKQSVLERAYPRPLKQRLGARYLESCAAVSEHVLYPLEILQAHQADCFLQTDTHPTEAGLVRVASLVVEALTGGAARLDPEPLLARITREGPNTGDLGSKLAPPVGATERFFQGNWGEKVFSNRIRGNNGAADIWISPKSQSPARLLIFGDSFGRGLARFLSVFYREVVFLRTPFFHVDIAAQMRPDAILSENVERYLSQVTHDSERPSFHMYPFLKGQPDAAVAAPQFAEAFSAVLSYPRPPHERFWRQFS